MSSKNGSGKVHVSHEEPVWFEAEELAKFEVDRWDEVDGGFQRKQSEHKVGGVETLIERGIVCPYPMVAEVITIGKDGKKRKRRLVIDGQHRIVGHVRKKRGMWVTVIYCDYECAREHFIAHNVTASPLRRTDQLMASTNEVALVAKELIASYPLGRCQSNAILTGVCMSANYADSTATVKQESVAATKVILDHWTQSSSWRNYNECFSKEVPNANKVDRIWSSTKILKALGRLSREYDLETLPRVMKILCKNKRSLLQPSGKLFRDMSHMRDAEIVDHLRRYVNPKLHGKSV